MNYNLIPYFENYFIEPENGQFDDIFYYKDPLNEYNKLPKYNLY